MQKDNVWICGNCGLNHLEHQGKLSQDSETHYSFICDECIEESADFDHLKASAN
jgi:hypothetical protein